MFDLETAIQTWRQSFRHGAVGAEDRDELEAHLRDLTSDLRRLGLSEREAFMVGTDRLGHPASLEQEYSKVNTVAPWKRYVLWMLIGYIAISVSGTFISAISSIASAVFAFSGIGGVATGTAMIIFQVLGWATVLYFLHRLSLRTSVESNDFGSWIGIAALAISIISPMLASAAQTVQASFFNVTEFGDSVMVSMVGGWVTRIAFLVACLFLVRTLSQTELLTPARASS